jgi:1-deoxy-D-xylulose-5-phosphate reductoisomerase
MKRLSLLGSTGSIGVSTLEVAAAHRNEFSIAALAAGRNVALLSEQTERFRPRLVVLADEELAQELTRRLGTGSPPAIRWGAEGYREAAAVDGCDMVVSAMVGAAGLLPTLAAIEAGHDIALANKETMVMAGRIVMARAAAKGVRILPVDSEHSAIFQALQGNRREEIRRIILTASGGPFWQTPREALATVTPAVALRHPNWQMGKKITIDSATMMNKGLEVIEARWLFDVPVAMIEVLIHPQSIVHSLVEYRDGSVIAQLGLPDMRTPIAYALSFPRRLDRPGKTLELSRLGRLDFDKPDPEKFPCLRIAYGAAEKGGLLPAVLNGANEKAVMAFMEEKIAFTDIPRVIEAVVNRHAIPGEPTLEEVLAADRWARDEAETIIKGIEH